MEHFFQSKTFKGLLICIIGLIILFVDFRAGMLVGYNRAIFSGRWMENYERNFLGPRPAMNFSGKGFMNAHGASGIVMKVASTSLMVRGEGADSTEKLVNIDAGTAIRRFQDTLKISDLSAGDQVIIVGSPNELGQIEAKLIRVVPFPLPSRATSTKQ